MQSGITGLPNLLKPYLNPSYWALNLTRFRRSPCPSSLHPRFGDLFSWSNRTVDRVHSYPCRMGYVRPFAAPLLALHHCWYCFFSLMQSLCGVVRFSCHKFAVQRERARAMPPKCRQHVRVLISGGMEIKILSLAVLI